MAWARRPRPRCTLLASRQARICGAKPLSFCGRGSAKQAIGTLRSRVAEMIARFNPTGAKVFGVGDNLLGGSARSSPDRSGRDGNGRRCLGLVRENEFFRSDRYSEDQMG